jgi:predicted Zn finger-like uncharacterized protein
MPIPVVCPSCKSRFTVSDQFAGRTGPCPKCKQTIKVPTPAAKAVVIHEPEAPVASSSGSGKAPTAPIKRRNKPVSLGSFAAAAVGAVLFMGIAALLPVVYPPQAAGDESTSRTSIPTWLLLGGGFAAALPAVLLGYAAVRNRELEPYQGRPLAVRVLTCALVYAGLWAIRGAIPWLNPAWQLTDMYEWFMLGPLFVAAGGLAALATLDLEPGSAAVHFSFFVLFTSLLRWLAGLSPL